MFRIYVGNLSFQTTEQGLSDLFGEHGTVSSVSIITDRFTGRSRGFAFVEMADEAEGKAAMGALDGQDFDGRTLRRRSLGPVRAANLRGRPGRG